MYRLKRFRFIESGTFFPSVFFSALWKYTLYIINFTSLEFIIQWFLINVYSPVTISIPTEISWCPFAACFPPIPKQLLNYNLVTINLIFVDFHLSVIIQKVVFLSSFCHLACELWYFFHIICFSNWFPLTLSVFIPSYRYITFIYQFTKCWTLGLFPVWHCYKRSCHKH